MIDYDELRLLSVKQKEQIDILTVVYQEKEILSDKFERMKSDLINEKEDRNNCQHLLEDKKKENQLLSLQLEEGFERERKNKKTMKAYDDENSDLRNKIHGLETELTEKNKEAGLSHSKILR